MEVLVERLYLYSAWVGSPFQEFRIVCKAEEVFKVQGRIDYKFLFWSLSVWRFLYYWCLYSDGSTGDKPVEFETMKKAEQALKESIAVKLCEQSRLKRERELRKLPWKVCQITNKEQSCQ